VEQRIMKLALPALRGSVPFLASTLIALTLSPSVEAQGDGPRSYWKTLSGSNAVTFWPIHATGNFNPFDAAHVVTPNASFEANLSLFGYHKVLPLFGRSTTASLLIPFGNISAEVANVPVSQRDNASGYGDPMLQTNVNLYGAPAINDLPSLMRYEPTVTVDLLTSLAIPVGEYDEDEMLNLGQNRWYGRIGIPVMWSLGSWVPGQRTTLEALPQIWLFSDNTDHFSGSSLKTDPILGIEAHLTHDLTENFWASLDFAHYRGGESSVAGVSGPDIDNLGAGITLGFQVSENLQISTSYFSTFDDSGANDMRGDEFRLMFTFGWHALIEGMRRLAGEDG
jgi:hypothetical protein